MTADLVPVAQYLRMSTEHQKYSLANQSEAICRYANRHGFVVVKTYSDPAKSGLLFKSRPGLQQLLTDVTAGNAGYRAVLVYDVSRWGRFQDTDEAAHYEFLCKAAGVPVHYCAETFANDRSLPSSIMKALKRVMAGEYSRELGVKVLEGQRRAAALGFKQGGVAGFGFRRMLVSSERVPIRILERGQRKGLATDRVVLVPGPDHEVQEVRAIFRKFTVEGMSLKAIARDLNRRGVPSVEGKSWNHSVVARMLTHPKYVGANVFNRNTMRLGSSPVPVPEPKWVVCDGAHEGIVDKETYALAQRIMSRITMRRTDEDILRALQLLLAEKGRLSMKIIEESSDLPTARTYWYRFGSLRHAGELIGYDWEAGRGRTSDARMLEDLRSIWRREGSLSVSIVDASTPKIVSSSTIKRRFGNMSRAYELVGYDWRSGLKRARERTRLMRR